MLSNDPIGKISFATGGEKEDYNVVTYVSKDKKDNRCAYTHTRTHTHARTHTHTDKHSLTLTHSLSHSLTHSLSLTHTLSLTHSHTQHTHTDKHSLTLSLAPQIATCSIAVLLLMMSWPLLGRSLPSPPR